MALPGIGKNSVGRHRRRRLDDDNSVEDQIPERERASASAARMRWKRRRRFPWVRLLDYGEAGNVNIKAFLYSKIRARLFLGVLSVLGVKRFFFNAASAYL